MTTHAAIAPSSLDLIVKCPGSVKLQASVPQLPETEEEAEGTAAHWVALRYAAGYGAELPVGTKFLCKGREWKVDLDMQLGAIMYARALGAPHGDFRFEDPVTISRVHKTHCWGTPDAWRFFPNYVFPAELGLPRAPVKLIRVGEYKFGHRFVEVFEMFQGSAYLSGVMERLAITDNDPDLWVEIVLVQPRCYHPEGPVRVWRGPAHMLRAVLNIAHTAAHEALGENPRTRTNDSCIDCRARHVCKAKQLLTYALVEFSTSAETVELPADAMGQELAMVEDAIDRLTARQTGLAAQAEALLRQGKSVAFYHMEPGQSRMVYREDASIDEIVGLGELIDINLRKPPTLKDTLVTPKQAIDLGVDENVMKQYAHRPPAGLKLTRDNSITARKVFSK